MKVGDLFMSLALVPDLKGWTLGQAVIDEMSSKLKRLAVEAALATTDVKKAAGTIGLELPKVKSHWERIKTTGDGVTNTFMRMAAAAAAFFSVAKIGHMVKETVELGGKLNDTAQMTGLSTEALQKWGYAAKLNSSSVDGVAVGVKKLSKGLADIGKETSPVRDAFNQLGISVNDPVVKSKDLNRILFLVATKFSAMPDGAKKTAIAMDLFGKSGAELIPTLNQGVTGIVNAGDELERLGGVIDGSAIGRLDDLGDNIDRSKVALEGLKNQAVVALLPLLERMMNSFQEWIAANHELIKSSLQSVVEALADALSTLASVVAFVVRHWKLFAAIIAGAMIIGGIMKIIRLIMFLETAMTSAAIQAAISWAMILGPILLIAAAIVALGLLIYKYRDQVWSVLSAIGRFFKEAATSIKNVFVRAWDAVTGAASDAWEAIKSGFRRAFEFIADLPIIGRLFTLVDKIRDLVSSADTSHEVQLQDLATMTPEAYHAKYPNAAADAADMDRRLDAVYPRAGATGAATGSVASPVARGGAGGVSVTNSYDIKIDAKNADARQVGDIVDNKLREHDERTRRETAAALGVRGQ